MAVLKKAAKAPARRKQNAFDSYAGVYAFAVAALAAGLALLALPESSPIPRRPFWANLQNMTNATGDAASEVVRRVSAARRPVILGGSPVARWPALARWTPARLALELPELPVVDESATSTFWWYDEGRQLKLPPRRTHPLRTNVTPAAFFLQKSDAYRQFHAKLHSPALVRLAAAADPREFLQNADRRPGLPPVDGAETFWAGDDGTTSHTHYDGDGNFYVQTHGRKRFTLWPPECWPEMALHPFPHAAHRQSQKDCGEAGGGAAGSAPPGCGHGGARGAVERMLRRAARFAGLEAAGAALGARALLRQPPAACAPLEAMLAPGELLYLPPFWFHRVASVGFSTALAVVSRSADGRRFEEACQAGLPDTLLGARDADDRAAAARRYLGALIHLLVGASVGPRYARRTIGDVRHAALDAPQMRCDAPARCGGGGGSAADAAAAASAAERDHAARVADVLAPGAWGGRRPLNGIDHILLQDYVEHVSGFAVGMDGLCAFVARCLSDAD